MIKKNDCVPKKVLNERKLRRQAIAVMVGGLVVAFLLGLIVGWFIPKNDKKNVTASAEVAGKLYRVQLPWIFPLFDRGVGQYSMVASQLFIRLTVFDSGGNSVEVSFDNGSNYISVPVSASKPAQPNLSTTVLSNYFSNSNSLSSFLFYVWASDNNGLIGGRSLTSYSITPLKGESYLIGATVRLTFDQALTFAFFVYPNDRFLLPQAHLDTPTSPYLQRLFFTYSGTPDSYNDGYSAGLSDGFLQGKNEGYQSGFSEGQNQGYNTGFNTGKNEGYNNGYVAGVAASGNNNFMSLITAVVDAPIKAFTSLLDFEILGYNMKNLALALLTAGLLVAAVRFFSRL